MRITLITILIFGLNSAFGQGFKKLSAKESGVKFKNQITEDDTLNGLSYSNLYNGGGVAIGDVNNDGLEDLYFTGNQVDDKLYLNQGNLKFKDVTSEYFKNQSFDFHTGVTMVDINNDGWLDIYVSCAGPSNNLEKKRNKLFINQEGKSFVDEAKKFGLDDNSATSQTVFFDADNDGDLDAYILNHLNERKNAQKKFLKNKIQKELGNDKLMINDNGKFSDQSKLSRINSKGNGLGVMISDLNNDFKQDIYVTNDGVEADCYFENSGQGKFRNLLRKRFQHISLNSAGVDVADFNNDGWLDILTVDVVSEDRARWMRNKMGYGDDNACSVVKRQQLYQFMSNSLQLNSANGFSEMAQFAGVSKTDRSWASLFADFDNDGFQDIFIANGIVRDIEDGDFNKLYEKEIQNSNVEMSFDEIQKLIPSNKLQNYVFKNNKDLTFSNKSKDWDIEERINVNGAAYGDLDNDGDLDLVCNSINDNSFIFENKMQGNFLNIELVGSSNNIDAIGAKVEICTESGTQYREMQRVHGYQSSMSAKLNFGIGDNEVIDSIIVRWSLNEKSVLREVSPNQSLTIKKSGSVESPNYYKTITRNLEKIKVYGLKHRHKEMDYNDFSDELLLPHKMSNLGPFITTGDLNMDGLEDIFIGGPKGQQLNVYYQTSFGEFIADTSSVWKNDIGMEDMESVIFDCDNDGDNDLFVVSGGNEVAAGDILLKDRLYVNDGKGNFTKNEEAIPNNFESGQKAISQDLNNDGWMDLLVFGRQTPKSYPSPTSSRVLINHEGSFVDQTVKLAPEFMNLGMVTDAELYDYDNDNDLDLILVGEWMPVTVFENNKGVYMNVTEKLGMLKTTGWWNSIDLIEQIDGSASFVLGNLGNNNEFHPNEEQPTEIYMNDFDGNGTNDIVLAKTDDDILYPIRDQKCSSEQMSFIQDKFTTYKAFSEASLESVYSAEKLENALHYSAQTFSNSKLVITNGDFQLVELPNIYQLGPITSTLVCDITKDGMSDFLFLGGKHEAEAGTLRYDGNPGYFVIGGTEFTRPQLLNEYKNVKSSAVLKINNRIVILLGVNSGSVLGLEYFK
ncbi:MAG: hypothetical protein ACI857_000168 [Arenicella sp.]|jgi:hypothetical protein